MTPDTEPESAPRNAYEAADALAAAGHHVDMVTDGQRYCYTGHCPKERP
ncbi:hypothetical protein [Streptomyces mexicanus]